MFDLNVPKLEKLIGERFTGKDESVVKNALAAFHAGLLLLRRQCAGDFQVSPKARQARRPAGRDERQRGAGLTVSLPRACASARVIPITPWTDIMELLRRELPKYGGSFIQCEDEIASISMAIGASYAGRVAVTGSSGPGISLKMEALGWAVMAEVPLVMVDVQRGGPSTGLPTQRRAIRSEHRPLRRPRRFAPRRAGAGQRRGLFLHRHRGRQHCAQIQRPGFHFERPGHRHAHRGVFGAEPRKSLPGHFARPDAGCRLQAVRFVRAGRRDAAGRARHAHYQRQISRCDRPRARRSRPSDRLAEGASGT